MFQKHSDFYYYDVKRVNPVVITFQDNFWSTRAKNMLMTSILIGIRYVLKWIARNAAVMIRQPPITHLQQLFFRLRTDVWSDLSYCSSIRLLIGPIDLTEIIGDPLLRGIGGSF